jgi:DNA-binding NtrC family response regulator
MQYSHFQLIAASTKDLDDATEQGEFLLDLRIRITGLDVVLPPLRERLADLPALIRLFFAREGIKVNPSELAKLEKICASYYWQGNIRQLYRVLHSLVVMSSYNSEELRADQLPVFKTMMAPGHKGGGRAADPGLDLPRDVLEKLTLPLVRDIPLDAALEDYEKHIIECALNRHATVNDVVSALGVSRSALAIKRQKYGLQDKVRRSL